MILKSISSPADCKMGSEAQPLKSAKGNGDFFSTILRSTNAVQEGSFHMASEPQTAGSTLKEESYFYLESLRRGLLGKGKPLDKISLSTKDIPMLKRFLCQCGFCQEDAENLLKELLQNDPWGEINLSRFFLRISELDPPGRKIYQPITLEHSAIPYLESALRYFGLTPKDIDHIISDSRVEGGGLDLNRFVAELKEISNRIAGQAGKTSSQGSLPLALENLEELGSQISRKGNGARICMQDLITALEEMAGASDRGNQLPPELKATIEQIVERAVIRKEKDKTMSSILSFSKPGSPNQSSTAKKDANANLFDGERPLSSFKENGGIHERDFNQKLPFPFPDGELRLSSRTDAGKGLGMGNGEEKNMVKPQTRAMDIPRDMKASTFSDAIYTVKHHQESSRSFPPAYVIDQVGRRISRSLQRGERTIRIQLKPPELGTLKVEMDIKDNILKLGIVTENSSVKDLLLLSAHELREALVEQGLKLERLDVQINHDFGQSLANSNEGLKEGQARDLNEMPFIAEDDLEGLVSGPWIMGASDHLLDLVA
jgi:hypothetical protein